MLHWARVLDPLARITAQRDLAMADAALVQALAGLLNAQRAGLYRIVEEGEQRRWFTRAEWRADAPEALVSSAGEPVEMLPPLEARPAALAALASPGGGHEPHFHAGPPACVVVRLAAARGPDSVLELRLDALPDASQTVLLSGVLRVYANHVDLLGDNERDTLTGLLNRKTFDNAFYRLAAPAPAPPPPADADETAAERDRRQAAAQRHHYLGVVDIDHFKRVNDGFGHLIGDEVLLLLSHLMRRNFRFEDLLFRFGGEEFVVLLRCGCDADAGIAFERLRSRVAQHAFPQVGHITISVGYTQVASGDSPHSAFARADKAVYWAKGHGRDQVCSHARLLADGHLADEAKVGDVELF